MTATGNNTAGYTRENTATTRLRRTTTLSGSTATRTTLIPIVPISADAVLGMPHHHHHHHQQQRQVATGNADNNKNSKSVVVNYSRFDNSAIIRTRCCIGIGIVIFLIFYIFIPYGMTIYLQSASFPDRIHTIRQSQPQYRWEICDPLRRSHEFCHGNNNHAAPSPSTIPSSSSSFLLYNNSFYRTRYVCRNMSVGANTHIMLPASTLACFDNDADDDATPINKIYHSQPQRWTVPSNLFESPPLDIFTNGRMHQQPISPIRVRFGRRTPTELFPDCDIPCYHDGEPISDRYVDVMDGNTVRSTWTISFSMEGPQYWPSIYIQPQAWKENRFWSTTSYKSEIPLPYYSKEVFSIWHNEYVPFTTGIKGGAFLATNCDSKNDREELVKDIINQHFRVDAIGSCLHNADPPNGIKNEIADKVSIMKQYLFYLAFENQCEDDYITEKLWGAYEAGTIPIYFGAPNVKDHVPYHSLIHVDDYNTTRELVEHLIEVSQNRSLYESYHAWRTQPVPTHFRMKYDITDTHSTCRTCRWAYSRMYGIGWNHTTQSLRPLNIGLSRQVCLSSMLQINSSNKHVHYLVQHPFVEEWYDADGSLLTVEPTVGSDEMVGKNTDCLLPLTNANRIVYIDHGKLIRTLYNHDGVIDLVVRTFSGGAGNDRLLTQQPVRLRLHFPLLQAPVRLLHVRSGVWHIQNEKSRFTILVATSFAPSVDTAVTKESEITYDISITGPIRVRVIVEDVDVFHEGASDVENFFGKLLADDFFNPIQVSVRIPVD